MKRKKWITYGLWILLSEIVGAVSGWLSREGIRSFEETVAQPPLSPPGFLFPIVWTILYALMGIGAARVSISVPSKARSRGLNLFVAQLAMNFLWTPIFFLLRAYGFGFLWLLALWGMVLWMILEFRSVDTPAAYLQIPYLLWLSFAAYLNFGVWILSK